MTHVSRSPPIRPFMRSSSVASAWLCRFSCIDGRFLEAGIVKAERQTLEEQLRQAAKWRPSAAWRARCARSQQSAHADHRILGPWCSCADNSATMPGSTSDTSGTLQSTRASSRNNLLAFRGRKQVLKLTVLDLNAIVRSSKRMIERVIPRTFRSNSVRTTTRSAPRAPLPNFARLSSIWC